MFFLFRWAFGLTIFHEDTQMSSTEGGWTNPLNNLPVKMGIIFPPIFGVNIKNISHGIHACDIPSFGWFYGKCREIYGNIYLEPKWLTLVLIGKDPCFGGLTFKNRGQLSCHHHQSWLIYKGISVGHDVGMLHISQPRSVSDWFHQKSTHFNRQTFSFRWYYRHIFWILSLKPSFLMVLGSKG